MLIALCLCSIGSCSTEEMGDEPNSLSPEEVTYEGTIEKIVASNCLNCHSDRPVNGATFSLSNFENVRTAVIDRGLIERIESGSMPPVGDVLSSTEVSAFKNWQKGGFLED